ncbi:MAG: polynucleotide kinase-phosphatase [Treponema sp.]|nr:polynucleotide kinase-phosphatase [Treponema sp.]MCL2252460.1 polynucleotide kinase-phosphatase [Treponema sp.]
MRIELPETCLVAIVGASSSGKSTFCKKYFKPTEVLSSDFFRAIISNDENNQSVTAQAFDALHYIAAKRLELGLLTVIDATNVQKHVRAQILRLAREQNCLTAAIVLNVPENVLRERNQLRSDRNLPYNVITRQANELRKSINQLQKEGFRYVYVLSTEEDIANSEIVRTKLWNNKKEVTGPFDIIGDIHGCFDELCELLIKLNYQVDIENFTASHPEGRQVIFLGDLCDRGPKNIEVLRLVMNMKENGNAWCVIGNHDFKLQKKLSGRNVQLTHGLDKTIEQLEMQPPEFSEKVKNFIGSLISHYVFDNGNLIAAHAGLKEKYHGRSSGRVREFCLYGETTGETDEYGLPVRFPWANEYRGNALVVYGHIPNISVQLINNTACIDTGCVFGGKLTAFRYPEKEIVQVTAKQEYYASLKPFQDKAVLIDDMLNIEDVLGQKILNTRLRHSIKVNEENSAAALELMSRFAADPHWLIYLPPTMSPCETSGNPLFLEYPIEAFNYYKNHGVGKVICEEKHMGSRAVIVLCKDSETAAKRFGITDNSFGIIYTRTGRSFFNDDANSIYAQTEKEILSRLINVLNASSFWKDFDTDWVCLDTELMPWSAKALSLLKDQYASVGRAGLTGFTMAANAVKNAVTALDVMRNNLQQDENSVCANPVCAENSIDLKELYKNITQREEALSLYIDAYRRYCWDIKSTDDYRIAPFHILATENKTWNTENHITHMQTIKKYMTGKDPIFTATNYLEIDLLDEESVKTGIKWWEELTSCGGEGMVVKPFDFIASKGAELLQPAVKCRGREYLRIIYGPEYLLGGNLERLKKRSLNKKRNLALNEFALGMEALERFTRNDPPYRVHECVFGILAMESEPVDPRL